MLFMIQYIAVSVRLWQMKKNMSAIDSSTLAKRTVTILRIAKWVLFFVYMSVGATNSITNMKIFEAGFNPEIPFETYIHLHLGVTWFLTILDFLLVCVFIWCIAMIASFFRKHPDFMTNRFFLIMKGLVGVFSCISSCLILGAISTWD